MEKYLFNDGTNVIREVQSKEDLMELAARADPKLVRVWVFPSNEWITYARFQELYLSPRTPLRKTEKPSELPEIAKEPAIRKKTSGILKKLLGGTILLVSVFLVYNFTRLTWETVPTQTVRPEQPANTPPMNIDSLIAAIETSRGTKLDKVTRTNLRIRNSWPDQILFHANITRDSSRSGIRYREIELVLDNATGYLLDEVELQLNIWKKGASIQQETIRFEKINYTEPGRDKINGPFVGDSISVQFLSIKAKSFNFCYSHDKQSNYGNLNDRWFCR